MHVIADIEHERLNPQIYDLGDRHELLVSGEHLDAVIRQRTQRGQQCRSPPRTPRQKAVFGFACPALHGSHYRLDDGVRFVVVEVYAGDREHGLGSVLQVLAGVVALVGIHHR
jgi:hypothetical protein